MRRIRCNEIERLIVKYANSARRKSGIRPFRTNWGLKRIARSHSHRMAMAKRIWHGDGVHQAGNALSHHSFWDWIKSLFYTGYSGENVGLMYQGQVLGFKNVIRTENDIALAQHKSWMRSSGHRSNMLNSNFSLIGVGVVRNKNGYYCTQLFYG
ncbi:MAG: CAP domain-containing protein [archaeon]